MAIWSFPELRNFLNDTTYNPNRCPRMDAVKLLKHLSG
uniref:Uncharacterized protein n=1 Tax=Arundo donax TaxID=35708 RepID=A0A0A9BKK9_ARUDO